MKYGSERCFVSRLILSPLADLFSGISSDAWRITGLLSNIVHLPAADLVEDLTSNATILTLELKRGSSSGAVRAW